MPRLGLKGVVHDGIIADVYAQMSDIYEPDQNDGFYLGLNEAVFGCSYS